MVHCFMLVAWRFLPVLRYGHVVRTQAEWKGWRGYSRLMTEAHDLVQDASLSLWGDKAPVIIYSVSHAWSLSPAVLMWVSSTSLHCWAHKSIKHCTCVCGDSLVNISPFISGFTDSQGSKFVMFPMWLFFIYPILLNDIYSILYPLCFISKERQRQ